MPPGAIIARDHTDRYYLYSLIVSCWPVLTLHCSYLASRTSKLHYTHAWSNFLETSDLDIDRYCAG
jgi:hypothetical protein